MKQRNWFPSWLIPLVPLGLMIFGANGIHAAIDSGKAPAAAPVAQTASGTDTVNSNAEKKAPPVVESAKQATVGEKEKARVVQQFSESKPGVTGPLNAGGGIQEKTSAAAAEAKTIDHGRVIQKKMDEASFFNAQIHDLAVQLIKNFNGDSGPGSPVAVSTFVDLNNLHKTSPFGRYLAEQLMGELQRAGFRVIEVRKTDSILVKERYGEYGLSRDIGEISNEAAAQLVLVGTYITRGKYILINARMVSNRENMLASSAMKILRKDRFLDRMLWPTMAPDTSPSVKIPIKEFGQPTEVKIMSGS